MRPLRSGLEGCLEAQSHRGPQSKVTLRTSGSELDALGREFASYDRERFGGPVSRVRTTGK